jgi:hypothetical protein
MVICIIPFLPGPPIAFGSGVRFCLVDRGDLFVIQAERRETPLPLILGGRQ